MNEFICIMCAVRSIHGVAHYTFQGDSLCKQHFLKRVRATSIIHCDLCGREVNILVEILYPYGSGHACIECKIKNNFVLMI